MARESGRYRSRHWFTQGGIDGFLQRSAMKAQGYVEEDFQGRPVIGICNNWSELTRCHLHFKQLAEAVKRGVWQAGGFPLEFPTMSLGADLMRPTGIAFMHRNLLSMEVEQTIRTSPLDGVVLLGACDDTIPAMLMAVGTVDIPAILLPGGPGLNGKWRGEDLGSSTDCHRFYAEFRAGRISAAEWRELESHIERSPGHCMTMGTASTMACIAEALGMAPSGSAAIPAVDSKRLSLAQAVGRRAVEVVEEDLRPSRIMTRAAFENATRMLACVAGSTNAVVHLIAIAGRVGVDLPLALFDSLSRTTPVLVNLKPSGEYLMEDFFYAGGVPAVLKEMGPLLHLDAMTVNGTSVGETVANVEVSNRKVIGPLERPFHAEGGLAVLYGNLAPCGAVVKQTAASAHLLSHTGRAVVFESYPEFLARIDDADLDVNEADILVVKNAGPRGAPGMPEWGGLKLPKKLLRRGVRDMVRISDSRMSGTDFGTVVLHVSPESATGGPLAVVQTGDVIQFDVPNRRLDLVISGEELERRLARWRPAGPRVERGYLRLYVDHVLQVHEGCDFDFLRGREPLVDEAAVVD
ncbi:MAG: dihydroxy-acid dehydratase [Candidatus Rokubacteria bacterium]|nr:dihydroxy-acid dehydratase [Candidatus Rokubacteria bacterium]